MPLKFNFLLNQCITKILLLKAPSQKGKIAISDRSNIGLGYETAFKACKAWCKSKFWLQKSRKTEEQTSDPQEKWPEADLGPSYW